MAKPMSSHPKWWLRLETQNGCLEQVFVLMFLCDGFPFTSVPKATLPDPGLQPSSDYLALAWFLRCFWEDEATGRVGAVILLLECQTDGSNGFGPHGILLQFWVSRMKNERRKRRKLKKGELRRLRRKLRKGQRRPIKHFWSTSQSIQSFSHDVI